VFGSLVQPATQTALTSHYTIAGRLLRVEAYGDGVAQWVASFLNGFHLSRTAATADTAAAVTLSVRRAALPTVPPGLQTFAINHGVCHTDGTHYYLAVDESLVVISTPAAQLVEVWFGTTPHARHPVALVNAFSYGLQAALRRAGAYDIHAAGVVAPATEAGALFIGSSGSGKTTLTLKLTEAGWRYLSDDMVLLRETPARLEAVGLRRLFAVAESSLAGSRLTQLGAALGQPVASDPTKRTLEPEAVFPTGRAEGCCPVALFFPRVTHEDETRLRPMSARESMQQLLRHCPWATYDAHAAPDYLRVLARLAGQCQAFELHAGRDLLLEPGRAAELLAPYLKT
jgi:hypothetical protein